MSDVYGAGDKTGVAGAAWAAEGLVLAGGSSRRMGHDKALARLGPGEGTMLEHAVHCLLPHVGLVRVAAGVDLERLQRIEAVLNNGRFSDGRVCVVADERTGQGPLGAIADAMRSGRGRYLLVVAADMPCVPADAAGRLLRTVSGHASHHATDAGAPPAREAAVAVGPDGRAQPLLGCYGRALSDGLERYLAEGRRSVLEWLGRIDVRPVAFRAEELENVNTPEDLDRVRRSRNATAKSVAMT